MKRRHCLFLALLLAVSLPACHYSKSGDILEPVNFFYPRKTSSFVYGAADGVITPEVREGSGHIGDLNYLITMYLRGPQDESLRSPFPAGCTLKKIYTEGDTLYVRFSEEFAALENTELTIACAALAKTCLSMTDASHISIEAVGNGKNIHIVLDEDSILFADHSAFETQNPTDQTQ